MDEITQAVERAIVDAPGASELAGAKVNLALHVTGRRADGFHNLETFAVFADYADVITASPSDERTRLVVKGQFASALDEAPDRSENLVMRAAAELARASGKQRLPSRKLVLTKRIPVAAGLGGGSADAAATLRLLNREWNLNLDTAALASVAQRLGADVPMCVHSQPLIAKGIGEEITLVPGLPAMPIVLAHPAIALPTASVFAQLGKINNPPLPPLPARFGSLLDVIFWLRQARNDLSAPAAAVTKTAAIPARVLMNDPECLFARMSGSGATAFGLFASIDAAERAAGRIREAKPHWWVASALTRRS